VTRPDDATQESSPEAYRRWFEQPIEVRYLDDDHDHRLCPCGDVGDVLVKWAVLTLHLCGECRKQIRFSESQIH